MLFEIIMYCLHMVHFVTQSNIDANTKYFTQKLNKYDHSLNISKKISRCCLIALNMYCLHIMHCVTHIAEASMQKKKIQKKKKKKIIIS